MIATRTPLAETEATARKPVAGGYIAVRLRGEQTGGAVAAIENGIPAGYPGPPLHIHPAFDEVFYVLEGTLTFRLEDRIVDAGPGSVVYAPGDVPHTFAELTNRPAKVLLVVTPSGHEHFFDDLADAWVEADGIPAPTVLGRLNAEHGIEVVGR